MYAKIPLLDETCEKESFRTPDREKSAPQDKASPGHPSFTYADMWLSYELNTDGELRENPLLVRPEGSSVGLTQSNSDPLCYLEVKSNIEGGDLVIILASNSVTVIRKLDYTTIGYFPASGEKVVV